MGDSRGQWCGAQWQPELSRSSPVGLAPLTAGTFSLVRIVCFAEMSRRKQKMSSRHPAGTTVTV